MSGSNLSTLAASGDPHAIGRALGEASAAALRDIVPTIGRFQALMREWQGTERLRALEAAARSVWPQYVRELEGMAHGAGVAFETVFLWNCRGDLPESGRDARRGSAAGCTTVMVPAQEGRPALVAHNEDDAPELHGHCRIVDVRPDDGPGFVSFYSPGLLPGHTFAVNRAGLVQTVNDVRPQDRSIGEAVGVPRHLVCRAVLDCGGLEAAIACIRDLDRASGFHHTLARAGDRRLLSVEAPASGCEVVEVDAPCAHANHLRHERFAHLPQMIAASSRCRQARADALIAGGALEHGDPLCVLGDVGGRLPIRRREKDCGDAGFTLASAVFRVAASGVDYEVFDEIMHPPVHRGEIRVEPSSPSGFPLLGENR